MKHKFLFHFIFSAMFLMYCMAIISCNKKFDEPPVVAPVVVTPTATIEQIKAKHILGGMEQITTSDVIEGIVVADDRTGNFYKQVVIQDASGGVVLLLNGYDLYTTYPVGTQIFISVNGLFLGDYKGEIELGGGTGTSSTGTAQIDGIAPALYSKYIQTGTMNNVVTPRVVTVSQLTTSLTDSFQSTLIQLAGFQFATADTGKTYAIGAVGSTTPSSVGFNIQNCTGDKIELYNSGYATFAGVKLPAGNGTITAVYEPYGTTKELLIRDTSDVQFTGTGCSTVNTGGNTGGSDSVTTISALLAMYNGSAIKLGSYKIGGTVISDASSKNISTGAVVIEDGSNKGVEIYFGGTISYSIGDSIVVDVTGDSLTTYKGSFEIKTAYNAVKPAPVATGKTVAPQVVTISQLNAGFTGYEYSLVQIQNATCTSGTFSGSKTLTDATGTVELYTSSSATFSSSTIPSGTHNWTCYGNYYNTTKEVAIRNTSDVQ